MNTTEAKELVRNWYGSVAVGSTGCCGPTTALQDASVSMGYSEAELAALPEGADLGLGCGNPQAIAAMRPGEVVVDLGSGRSGGPSSTSPVAAENPPSWHGHSKREVCCSYKDAGHPAWVQIFDNATYSGASGGQPKSA